MNMRILISAAGLLLSAAGCVKRTERITILADGSATLHTVIEGDAWDFRGGDALPTAEGGWTIHEERELDKDGNERLKRTAERQVPAAADWPLGYAPAGAALEALALQFPSTLIIEPRADGTYYHFRRVYRRRDHAVYEYEQQQIMEEDDIKPIRQKEPNQLTDEERRQLADAMLRAHIRKTASIIDRVIEEHLGRVPQDTLLTMRARALAVFQSVEVQSILDRVAQDQAPAEDFESLEARLHDELSQAAIGALEEAGVSRPLIRELLDSGMRSAHAYDITRDLGDEEWMVALQMPGQIVAHNSFEDPTGGLVNKTGVDDPHARSMDVMITDSQGRAVQLHNEPFQVAWRFQGTAVYDRDVVLMATSFVPQEPRP